MPLERLLLLCVQLLTNFRGYVIMCLQRMTLLLHIHDEALELASVQWVMLFTNRVNPAVKSLLTGRARATHGIIYLPPNGWVSGRCLFCVFLQSSFGKHLPSCGWEASFGGPP